MHEVALINAPKSLCGLSVIVVQFELQYVYTNATSTAIVNVYGSTLSGFQLRTNCNYVRTVT